MREEPKKQRLGQAEVLEYLSSKMESQIDTRRRFIKKAIATAPMILTVTAGPVWARNCTPSGRLSGNLSGQKGTGLPCCGKPIKYWAEIPDRWPILHPDTPVPALLTCLIDSWYDQEPPLTCIAMLNMEITTRPPVEGKLIQDAIAGVLNSYVAEWDYGLTDTQVVDLFCQAYNSGNLDSAADKFDILNNFNEDDINCSR
jgi:hypothetical protein